MSTRDLIDAIESGDSVAIQSSFEDAMMSRIAERLDVMRQQVAKNMFRTEQAEEQAEEQQEEVVAEDVEDLDEAAAGAVKHNEIHVQHVGGGKYKVHAVGKSFADGIKAGEHVSDTDLDDFSEMGGKVKHVKKAPTA